MGIQGQGQGQGQGWCLSESHIASFPGKDGPGGEAKCHGVCTLGLQVGTTNPHGSGGATHPIIQFQYDVVRCFIRAKLQVYHSVHTQLCDGD